MTLDMSLELRPIPTYFTEVEVKYLGIGRNSRDIRNDVSVDMSNDIEQLNRLVS